MSLQLGRVRISESAVLVGLAGAVGLSTAAGVVLFRIGIEGFHTLFNEIIGEGGLIGNFLLSLNIDPRISIIFSLALAGAIVGMIMSRFVGHEKYHGVPAIMESVALAGGRLRYRVVPFKAFSSAISLGAGASVGPEDPSVQIGANIGSLFGDKLHLSEERVKLLVAAGAASAIAAAFNAPIAGVFFALEIILGEFTTRSFGVVVLAAVISSATNQSLRGNVSPIFGGLDYVLGSPLQLPFYVLLGIALAFFSSFAIRFFHSTSDFWHARVHLPRPVQTALTGAFVGLIGILLPEILGPGEEFMHNVLTGHATEAVWLLVLIALVKLIMTAISQSGGFVGGIFAPTLFMGIALGSSFGQLLNQITPSAIVGNPQSYAIAGMAGLMAGIVRAPITAIMLVFELTDDYNLILPIMLTSVVCALIVERIGPDGIYLLALHKQGIHLQQGRDVDVMQGIHVSEAMQSPAPFIHGNATLRELRDAFHHYNARALCVLDDDQRLCGIVTLGDLQRAFEKNIETGEPAQVQHVADICTREVLTARPRDAVWTAVRSMGARDIGRLPVIDSNGRVVGMLSRHDIMTAYNTAIARKLQDQHNAEQIRLHTLTGAHVIEYEVTDHSNLVEQQIKDIRWPPEAVVASILRKGKLIVPHGDTRLRSHDRVTIVADPQAEPLLDQLFSNR